MRERDTPRIHVRGDIVDLSTRVAVCLNLTSIIRSSVVHDHLEVTVVGSSGGYLIESAAV